jgi:Caspase domain
MWLASRVRYYLGSLIVFSKLFRIVLSFVCLFTLLSHAAAAKRVALIIGNENYTNLALLANPVSDAKATAALLIKNGFTVHRPLSRKLRQSNARQCLPRTRPTHLGYEKDDKEKNNRRGDRKKSAGKQPKS